MGKASFKTILVAINIAGVSGRDTLSGIFAFVNTGKPWNLKLLDSPARIPDFLASGEPVDGIITRFPEESETERALANTDVPIVFTNFRKPCKSLPPRRTVITLNDADLGRAAADHFASLGTFGAFAYVSNRVGYRWSRERGLAFVERLGELIGTVVCPPLDLADKPAVENFLRTAPKPLAIFASWDMAALEVLETCHRLNLSIPDQVAILGVDNEELVCNGAKPTLSSVEPDHVELGRQACQELERLFRGRPGRIIRIAKSVKAIHQRESTAIVPPSAQLVLRAQKFIRLHAGERLTPTDVVRHLGVSRSLAFLRFKQRTGESLGAAIARERIAVLKKRLVASDDRLTAVAVACGFRDSAELTRFFKRETGQTPTQWKATRHSSESERPYK